MLCAHIFWPNAKRTSSSAHISHSNSHQHEQDQLKLKMFLLNRPEQADTCKFLLVKWHERIVPSATLLQKYPIFHIVQTE